MVAKYLFGYVANSKKALNDKIKKKAILIF